jgi:3-dehydroquinate synthase
MKTMAGAEQAYDWLIQQGTERGDTVVALGGGVIGDLAGFVAATYLRGVPLVQVPTTLLAMVDSSIGGKVAINHRLGKNLIGAFHQPRLVLADVGFLSTLPTRELAAGWAEVVKMGLILDEELFAQLEADPAGLLTLRPQLTVAAIARSVELKARVVAEDERETGQRMLLNYGHTVGHAIEAATHYGRLLHGEAVAIGMRVAAEMSVALGMLAQVEAERQSALLDRLGLPHAVAGVQSADLWGPLRRDKKARQSRLRWVLLERLGHATVRDDVPVELVEAALRRAGDSVPGHSFATVGG